MIATLLRSRLRDRDLTADQRAQLLAWRRQRWVVLLSGPGLPTWAVTRAGRVALTQSVNELSTSCQRTPAPVPPEKWDF